MLLPLSPCRLVRPPLPVVLPLALESPGARGTSQHWEEPRAPPLRSSCAPALLVGRQPSPDSRAGRPVFAEVQLWTCSSHGP